MPRQEETAQKLLDAAERLVRRAGYNGFSFREIAHDVGIKSASVHHHFPTKEALVSRLAERYTDAFMAGVADAPAGPGRIRAYRDAFRRAIEGDGGMCLCGMLGAESAGLPPPVAAKARQFFARAIEHLAQGLEGTAADPRRSAAAVLAQLEGAVVLARAFDDVAKFDEATADLADGPAVGGRKA